MLRKALTFLLIAAMVASLFVVVAPEPVSAAGNTYYVSVNGNDTTGNGSLANPWKTIGKAASIATAGDTVKIRAGTYRETVTPANSGTAGNPITYEPYNGESVTISGADLVTGAWTVHSGNIYKKTVTLSMGDWKNQVFVDGVSMQLARWPNAGTSLLAPSTALTDAGTDNNHVVDSALTQPNGYWNGAGVVVTDYVAWNLSSTTVTSYTTGQLNLGSISTFGLAGGSPYYLVGKLGALDTGKEWYYDSGTSTLYLQTSTGDSPANHVVEAKARNLAFNLTGKNDIHINGIKLFASTLSTNDSHDIDLEWLDIKYPTHYEIDPPGVTTDHSGIQLGGTNNILHNSTLAHSMGSLVTVTGENNRVVNNLMHDANYGPFYGTGTIMALYGRELLISHNTLFNSGSHVIDGRPLNSRIQYNYAYNAMTLTDDGGFFYFSNVDGEGTEIHHNILSGANTSSIDGGIYLDFATWDFSVFNNVISDVNGFGVFFHAYNLFTTAYNNSFYNQSWFRMKNDGGAADAYGTRVINNISYDDMWIAPSFGVVENNNFKSGDPLFADAANGDFHLQSTSTAINAGEVIAGITDGYVGSAPDIGAYEYGGTNWTAGHNFANPPNPTFTTTNLRYRQLLNNGFFERDPSDGWTKTNSQTATIQVSDQNPTVSRYMFTRGLQLGSGADGVEQTVTGLQPNTEYELRGFGKAAASGQTIRIGVKSYGGTDTYQEVTATSWTENKIKFTTGAANTSATVYVYKPTTGGYAYADDVSLVEVDHGSGGFFYSENFESTTIGQMPTGWTTSAAGGSASVQTAADGANTSNKALAITQTSYGVADVSASKTFANATGTVNVHMRMKANQTNSLLSEILSDSSGTTLAQIAFRENGKFGYVDSVLGWQDTSLTYSANQWYDVDIVVDLSADTYNLSVNGSSLLTNKPLMAAASNVAKIQIATNMWYPGTVHYDNLVVSTGRVYSESFENTSISQMPTGWTTSAAGGSASVQTAADGANTSNKALAITQTSFGVSDVSASKPFMNATGSVNVHMRMKADQTNSLLSEILSDSSGTTLAQIAFRENGKFGYVDSVLGWQDTSLTYSANQWYDVDIVVDLSADTYNLSINGSSLLTNKPLMAAASNVAKIQFATNMWYPGTAHYDNITVID